eukprot:4941717-Alexandrium_andersonii.AAC.1
MACPTPERSSAQAPRRAPPPPPRYWASCRRRCARAIAIGLGVGYIVLPAGLPDRCEELLRLGLTL